MSEIDITIETVIYPTEDSGKVESAIKKVFGEIELKKTNFDDKTELTGKLEGIKSLNNLRKLIFRGRIRDAARVYFNKRVNENILVFRLNKQAAYVGRVSFYPPGGFPLGPIKVTIIGNVEKAIKYLCAKGAPT